MTKEKENFELSTESLEKVTGGVATASELSQQLRARANTNAKVNESYTTNLHAYATNKNQTNLWATTSLKNKLSVEENSEYQVETSSQLESLESLTKGPTIYDK